MKKVTVIIPVGPDHEQLARRASASVENQTVPCEVFRIIDEDGNGPGWARNEGIKWVGTDYVMFLDADDWLEPDAVEKMLELAEQHPTRYVYSDWLRDNEVVQSPPTGYSWCAGTWHPITSLIPSNWVHEVNGFDETLPGGEDTDFYLRLTTTFRCGIRLPEALVHYSPDGKRAKMFHKSPEFRVVMSELTKKYGGKMACCGRKDSLDQTPLGQRQPGDVLAAALWGGNRTQRGNATGRRYPRTGNGKQVWVDPRDITADPRNWQEVPAVKSKSGKVDMWQPDSPLITPAANVQQLAAAAMHAMSQEPPMEQYKADHGTQQQTAPDIAAIIRMSREGVS